MLEALLMVSDPPLETVIDAIDIYEGSLPPAATFQVVDLDSTVEVPETLGDE